MVEQFTQFVAASALMPTDDITYNVIGLVGEAGEVAEWLKKSVYRKDARFTDQELKDEVGDVLHYIVRIALCKGWTLEEVMQGNIDKLTMRRAG